MLIDSFIIWYHNNTQSWSYRAHRLVSQSVKFQSSDTKQVGPAAFELGPQAIAETETRFLKPRGLGT